MGLQSRALTYHHGVLCLRQQEWLSRVGPARREKLEDTEPRHEKMIAERAVIREAWQHPEDRTES